MHTSQQIAHNNIIPGVMTMGTEFFATEFGVLRIFHNKKEIFFEDMPDYVYRTIKKAMGNQQATIQDMHDFAFGRWGGMDGKVDIDEHGNPSEPEYIPNYTSAYFDNGSAIGDGPLRVLKLIGLKDNQIADKLFLSRHTVAGHCAYLFFNTQTTTRTELALWATKKGII